MGRLTRSQKKGKKSSYTSRFLKKRIRFSSYDFGDSKLTVAGFTKSPKSKAVVMVVEGDKRRYYPSPIGIRKNDALNAENSGFQIKPLKDFKAGDLVCNVEFRPNVDKFLCRAAGACARIVSFENNKVKLLIKKRSVQMKDTLRAMRGQVSNADFWMKPIVKAGTASAIQRAKGKKYPHVSSSKMNVQENKIGGSYKKRRGIPMTVSRRAPPGRKIGHIAARRTGAKKKK